MDKLNVLWIIPYLDRRRAELASSLDALGIGIHVAAQRRSPYLLPGINNDEPADGRGADSFRSFRARARALLESSNASLVHAVGLKAPRVATALAGSYGGLRVVAEYDGGTLPAWCRIPHAGFDHPRIEQVLLRERHHLAYFRRRTGVRTDAIRLIPHGLKAEWYERPGMQCRARKDATGLFVLGASLEHMSLKQLKLLLAASDLLPGNANIRILLIDRSDRRDEIIRELHRWPAIVVGKTHVVIDKSDPGIFWSVCTSALHFPGQHSGLNELRDSMASAVTPIIVAPDQFRIVENLATGLLVSSANPHSLYHAIQYLSDDLATCRAMALTARETALTECPFDRAVAELARTYHCMTSEQRRLAVECPASRQSRTENLEHARV